MLLVSHLTVLVFFASVVLFQLYPYLSFFLHLHLSLFFYLFLFLVLPLLLNNEDEKEEIDVTASQPTCYNVSVATCPKCHMPNIISLLIELLYKSAIHARGHAVMTES